VFERLPIPTPFQVGDVNAYLAGRTLVDPGPDSEEAWATLLDHLEERAMTPDDVEQVVVTHPHPDHFGLAERFHDTGTTVYASEPAADIMRDFQGRLAYEQEFFVPFFERHGMARSTAETITELPEVFLPYAPDVETDELLHDGDTVTVDGTTLSVTETRGHAPGELLFEFPVGDERHAIVGDHVLADITPNPLLLPPEEPGGDRPRSLVEFNHSLDRLAGRQLDRILAGHRDIVENPAARIREIREAHEERTDDVSDLLDGPTTAVDVMEGLFGDLPATERFPGMSEAIGHLDVLEDRDRVVGEKRGGMVVYELV
jgi:glyoxylase-like metal-dependent hydrolase (beta-lactamase superfamily II)